jgi:3-oxoacyl-[acyl-carrier-protein] synthase-3
MVSVSKLYSGFRSVNSISLSANTVKECLFSTGIVPSEIGLLINTGIYRYRNTGEPSIASLIQHISMPASRIKPSGKKENAFIGGTFSFDLGNGGCGWLSGIEIIDGFIRTGRIKHGIVVTADSEPFPGFSENYRFYSAAASVLLSGTETEGGFSHFRTYTFPEFSEDFTGLTRFGKKKGRWGRRNILEIRESETYVEDCIKCAAASVDRFLGETGYSMGDIDLIIPSQSPKGLLPGLKDKLSASCKLVEVRNGMNRELHTAGPAFALKNSWNDNSFIASENILFLTVGSGISVSIALFQNPSC